MKYIKNAEVYKNMVPKVKNVEKKIAKDLKWNAKNKYTSQNYYKKEQGEATGKYEFVMSHIEEFESLGFEVVNHVDRIDSLTNVTLSFVKGE